MIELEQDTERMRYAGNSRYVAESGRYVQRDSVKGPQAQISQWELRGPEGELLDSDVHLGNLFTRNSLSLDLTAAGAGGERSVEAQQSFEDKYNELLAAYNAINLKAVMFPSFKVERERGIEASKNNILQAMDSAIELIDRQAWEIRELTKQVDAVEGAAHA